MKSASKPFLGLVAIGALVLTGCTHKPVRPAPSDTMGTGLPGGGNGATSLNPTENSLNPGGLENRDTGLFANSDQVRNLTEPVYFDFDRSNIKASERPKVQAAKDLLDKHPEAHLLLEGHCDWRGTAEYNLALGDRRANEVKKYLLTLGVSADKLDTVSKGSEEATKNGSAEVMAHDRRVDFVLEKPGAGAGPAGGAPAAGAPAGAPAGAGAGTGDAGSNAGAGIPAMPGS